MSLVKLFVVVSVALAGCGDNKLRPDASIQPDATIPPDAPVPPPPPPALGAQIDRMGRPAISTALVALLAPAGAARTAQKEAYNHAADPSTWRTTVVRTNVTIVRELETNLAVFDVLDRGLGTITGAGCGNALRLGVPGADAYEFAARLLTDDQLYVDTSRATCPVYFALEMERANDSPVHMTCGGRMLSHDVIDVTYSLLMAGRNGLDLVNDLFPRLHDGVPAHSDVDDDTFPFLGPPHVP